MEDSAVNIKLLRIINHRKVPFSIIKALIHAGPTNNTAFDEAAPANSGSSVWNAVVMHADKPGLCEACNSAEVNKMSSVNYCAA